MGFTDYEKMEFEKTLRPYEKIKVLRDSYIPDDLLQFLASERVLRQVRDYAIISKIKKTGRPESVTMTYLLDVDTNIYNILLNWQEFLSPPVSLYKSF